MSQPSEIFAFCQAIKALGGIESVESSKWYLPDIALEYLSLVEFGNLPHAVINRSGGALDGEVLVTFLVRPQINERGFRSVEFLSWWVRDQSRGGSIIQIRSLALPPEANNRIQLGSTLSFSIELFVTDENQDIATVLAIISSYTNSLEQAKKIYARALSANVL